MHQRLAETMSFVEEKRRELLQSLEGVDGERLCRRASPGGWSAAEILEHLRMVESGVARLITERVSQAKEAGLGEERSTSSVMRSVVLGNGLSLGEIKHTHPVLGELDLYQWLIFLGNHEGRHRKQIERTLQSIPE